MDWAFLFKAIAAYMPSILTARAVNIDGNQMIACRGVWQYARRSLAEAAERCVAPLLRPRRWRLMGRRLE